MQNKDIFVIDRNIKTSIINELKRIENEYQIDILYAVESGSRAWGFPSVDSDYDVRFIFIRSFKDYLRIKQQKDTVTFPIHDDLDMCGWDIRKVLHHVIKSKAVIFEWFQSPIVYLLKDDFKSNMWNICIKYFSPLASLSHYLGICKKYSLELSETNQIKIKKIFYILRPLFSAKWIYDNESIPPMVFQDLTENSVLPKEIDEEIKNILIKKYKSNEKTLIEISDILITYIREEYKNCEEQKERFTKRIFSSDRADDYFFTLLMDKEN